MANIEHRDITASADIHNPKGFVEASNSSVLIKDKDGNNAYIQLVENRVLGNVGAGITSVEIEQTITATEDKIPSSNAVVNAISGKLDSTSHGLLADAGVHNPKGFTAAASNTVIVKNKSDALTYQQLAANTLLGNTGSGISAISIESSLSGTSTIIPSSKAVKDAIDAIGGGSSGATILKGAGTTDMSGIADIELTINGLGGRLNSLMLTETSNIVNFECIVTINTYASILIKSTFLVSKGDDGQLALDIGEIESIGDPTIINNLTITAVLNISFDELIISIYGSSLSVELPIAAKGFVTMNSMNYITGA